MALTKISDFDPNYRDSFNGKEIKGHGVYTESNEKIGTVSDILVDEDGRFRYFVVDLGFWIFGKKVLLPVGRSRVDDDADRVYAIGITRDQAESLPEFNEQTTTDYDYEERVRGVYRTPGSRTATGMAASQTLDTSAPLDRTAPLEASAPLDTDRDRSTYNRPAAAGTEYGTTGAANRANTTPGTAYNRDNYTYQQDPSLYELSDRDHQNLKLYEERLVANKRRVKSGEVTIGKHVETETERVSVPIEKERVIIERVTPEDAGKPVAPGEASFREGEVAHMELYEETADIQKQAVVREEVRVKKVVDQETVEAEETVRREELDIDSTDVPVNRRNERRQ